jgi:hypothetical protein
LNWGDAEMSQEMARLYTSLSWKRFHASSIWIRWSKLDWRWTKWHLDRFFSEHISFILSVPFHKHSTLIPSFIYYQHYTILAIDSVITQGT